MTEQQHEAGRETDALVARAVMGIDTEEREWCEQWAPLPGGGTYHERCQRCGSQRATYGMAEAKTGPCRIPVPAYSTDIAAAMLVVERLMGQSWAFDVTTWDVEQTDVYRVTFGRAFYPLARMNAPTLPLAICRAALAAKQEG